MLNSRVAPVTLAGKVMSGWMLWHALYATLIGVETVSVFPVVAGSPTVTVVLNFVLFWATAAMETTALMVNAFVTTPVAPPQSLGVGVIGSAVKLMPAGPLKVNFAGAWALMRKLPQP